MRFSVNSLSSFSRAFGSPLQNHAFFSLPPPHIFYYDEQGNSRDLLHYYCILVSVSAIVTMVALIARRCMNLVHKCLQKFSWHAYE